MRKLYWLLGAGFALLAIVGVVTFVALSQRQTAYTPPSSTSLVELPAATAQDPTGELSAATAVPEPAQASTAATTAPIALAPTAAPSAVPLILQQPVGVVYDDFTRLASGWAPLFVDAAGNFNGYSAGAYRFAAATPNKLLYDIQAGTSSAEQYAVDLRYERGTGSFGLLLDVQGDAKQFASLSYTAVSLMADGTVVVGQRGPGTPNARTLAKTSPAAVSLAAGTRVRLEVDAADGLLVRVNGAEALRVPDAQIGGGAIGLFAASADQPLHVAFDNVLYLAQVPVQPDACANIRTLFVPPGAAARAEGDDVRLLQERIARLGYDVGETDAIYGPRTAAAVIAFQQHNNLAQDGVVGPATWCALLSDAAVTAGGVPETGAEQQAYRAIDIAPAPELITPLLVSVRQADKTWRLALLLPGQSGPVYIETEGDAYDPALSPDRQQLAFTSDRGGTTALWLLNLGGGAPRQVTPSNLKAQFPAWSPDGRSLIYTAEPLDAQPLAARDFVLDLASGQAQLFSNEHMGWADWSANNEMIFTRWTGKSFDLFRANPDGSGLINLTNSDDIDEDIPAWSPDGNQVAFVASLRSAGLKGRQVYIMDRDGAGGHQITALTWPSSNPAWSPDGSVLAFANQPADGVWQPWLAPLRGGAARQIGANSDRIWFMSWPRFE
jgi:peptidoglycan hydrolase-like protein with peptidoglycan-binding domain